MDENSVKKQKERRIKSNKELLIHLGIKVGILVALVWIVLTFVIGVHVHYGNNMHPAVRDGDLVFGFKLQQPYINAVVIYEHNGKTKVGRVIAMESNKIEIFDDGTFKVNDIVPSEEVFYPTNKAQSSSVKYPYTVPKGKVFILNDFREDTDDSRSFGAVDIDDLKGTLIFSMRRRGF